MQATPKLPTPFKLKNDREVPHPIHELRHWPQDWTAGDNAADVQSRTGQDWTKRFILHGSPHLYGQKLPLYLWLDQCCANVLNLPGSEVDDRSI